MSIEPNHIIVAQAVLLAIQVCLLVSTLGRAKVAEGKIVPWEPGLSFDGQSVEEREYADHVPSWNECPQREGMEVVSREAAYVADDLWRITWKMRFIDSTPQQPMDEQ